MAPMVWLLVWLLSTQGSGFWCSMHPGERSAGACGVPDLPHANGADPAVSGG